MPYTTCPHCGLLAFAVSGEDCYRCGTRLTPCDERPPPGTRRAPGEGAAEALRRMLELARFQLEMDAAVLTVIAHGREEVRAVDGDADRFGLSVGLSAPVEETICQRVLDGDVDGLVADVRRDERVRDLPAPREMDLGAYLGVPLSTAHARLYMLCCFAAESRPALTRADVRFLRGLGESVVAGLDSGHVP